MTNKQVVALILLLTIFLTGCSFSTDIQGTESTGAFSPTTSTTPSTELNPSQDETLNSETESDDPVDLKAVYTDMATTLTEMAELDTTLAFNMCGIQTADCKQMVVAKCTDGLRVDEIWLLEAVDDAAMSRLQELARSRLSALSAQTESYSPEQFAVVQKAELIVSGSYLALLVTPNSADLAGIFQGSRA